MFRKKEQKTFQIDQYLIFFLIYLAIFLLLPYGISIFKKDMEGIAFLLLLYVNPILCTLFGSIRTYRAKFQPLEAMIPMITFLFAIIFLYNKTALIYVPFYGIMYLIGSALGGYARFKESEDYKKKKK